MRESLYVFLGAGLGGVLRYWVGILCRIQGQAFPWPTLLINVVGSFVLGAFAAAALLRDWPSQSRLFFAVGVCGGFTTFSTFSLEAVRLLNERAWKAAGAYCLLSLVLSVAACFLGAGLAERGMMHVSLRARVALITSRAELDIDDIAEG
jgi:CrcB protein